MTVPLTLNRIWINAQESSVRCLNAIAERRPRLATPAHLATGLRGEQAALFEIRRRGYTVVAQRWSTPKLRGDIDLVAWDGVTLCFIEVKTRTVRDMTPAESAIDDDKRSTLRKLASVYVQTFPEAERRSIPVRFDVIAVYALPEGNEFELFRNAFGWS